jgi:hypothetical protein
VAKKLQIWPSYPDKLFLWVDCILQALSLQSSPSNGAGMSCPDLIIAGVAQLVEQLICKTSESFRRVSPSLRKETFLLPPQSNKNPGLNLYRSQVGEALLLFACAAWAAG